LHLEITSKFEDVARGGEGDSVNAELHDARARCHDLVLAGLVVDVNEHLEAREHGLQLGARLVSAAWRDDGAAR